MVKWLIAIAVQLKAAGMLRGLHSHLSPAASEAGVRVAGTKPRCRSGSSAWLAQLVTMSYRTFGQICRQLYISGLPMDSSRSQLDAREKSHRTDANAEILANIPALSCRPITSMDRANMGFLFNEKATLCCHAKKRVCQILLLAPYGGTRASSIKQYCARQNSKRNRKS